MAVYYTNEYTNDGTLVSSCKHEKMTLKEIVSEIDRICELVPSYRKVGPAEWVSKSGKRRIVEMTGDDFLSMRDDILGIAANFEEKFVDKVMCDTFLKYAFPILHYASIQKKRSFIYRLHDNPEFRKFHFKKSGLYSMS